MKKYLTAAGILVLGVVPLSAASVDSGRNQRNFSPNAFASTKTCAAATTSASATGLTASDDDFMIYNAGTVPAFIRWGVGAQTAVTTDVIIPPGTVQVFGKNLNGNADTLACITSSGTATLYIITGFGR